MKNVLEQLSADLKVIKKGLRACGISSKILSSIETRALRSARRTTGAFPSNRQSRWRLDPRDPQYAPEGHCKLILIKLLASLLEFDGAPAVDPRVQDLLAKYYGRRPQSGSYRDPLTLESMSFDQFCIETMNAFHGHSWFHIGHLNPKSPTRHRATNIMWMTKRSNAFQGDVHIDEARQEMQQACLRYGW